MKTDLNVHGVKIKTGQAKLVLDPNLVRIVKLLARQAAEKDFQEQTSNN